MFHQYHFEAELTVACSQRSRSKFMRAIESGDLGRMNALVAAFRGKRIDLKWCELVAKKDNIDLWCSFETMLRECHVKHDLDLHELLELGITCGAPTLTDHFMERIMARHPRDWSDPDVLLDIFGNLARLGRLDRITELLERTAKKVVMPFNLFMCAIMRNAVDESKLDVFQWGWDRLLDRQRYKELRTFVLDRVALNGNVPCLKYALHVMNREVGSGPGILSILADIDLVDKLVKYGHVEAILEFWGMLPKAFIRQHREFQVDASRMDYYRRCARHRRSHINMDLLEDLVGQYD
jgi:hypothetical protein